MKKILAISLFLALLVTIGAYAEEGANIAENIEMSSTPADATELIPVLNQVDDVLAAVYPCMVTGDYVRERKGPGTEYEKVCKHRKGEIVNIVEMNGDWWKLANGNYMSAQYLEPMCSNDVPGADVEETEDFLVRDEDEEPTGDLPRMLGFTNAWSGAKKEDVVAYVHNCVLLITRERCIECYQDDKLTMRIDLVLSSPYIKFEVKEGDGEPYQIDYVYEIVNLVKQHSTDYGYFVVID